MDIKIEIASVKVMRSHDYCHFEVCLSSNDMDSDEKVDELRKKAARLADKAVEQYKVAKTHAFRMQEEKQTRQWAIENAKRVRNIPEPDRTVRDQAELKAFDDAVWQASREYDYQDDWGDANA